MILQDLTPGILFLCSDFGSNLNHYTTSCRGGEKIIRIVKKEAYEKEEAYELWKNKGHISLRTCDICGAIGVFIFGWLLWYVYNRAGVSGWKIFVPIIFFYVLGMQAHPIFIIIGLAIYVYAWHSIHKTIKNYQERYNRELEEKT